MRNLDWSIQSYGHGMQSIQQLLSVQGSSDIISFLTFFALCHALCFCKRGKHEEISGILFFFQFYKGTR